MTHNEFIEKYDHQKIDIDNYPWENGQSYIYQCTDLVSLYINEVHNKQYRFIRGSGGPADILTDWPNSFVFESDYDLIINDWNDVNQIPKQGDIMIWSGWPANQFGHIAVVHQSFPGQNRWVAFEQNAGGGTSQGTGEDVSKLRVHSYTASAGFGPITAWLRPKSVMPNKCG